MSAMTAADKEHVLYVAQQAAKAAVEEVRCEIRREVGLRISLAKWQLIALGLGSGVAGGVVGTIFTIASRAAGG